MLITDCHIHIQLMKKKRANFDQVLEFCRSPKAFLKHMDSIGLDRAVLINYVSPDLMGFTSEVNQFITNYVKHDPKRLIACGSVHPRHSSNVQRDIEEIVRMGIRMIKIHPPHQLLY